MNKIILILLLSILLLGRDNFDYNYSQQKVDSLTHIISVTSGPNLVDNLLQLSAQCMDFDFNKSSEYAIKARDEAIRIGYKKGEYLSLLFLANLYSINGQLNTALDLRYKALDIKQNFLESRSIQIDYYNIGKLQISLRNFDKAEVSLQKALEYCNKTDDKFLKKEIFYNIGLNYRYSYNFEKSLQAYDSALALTDKVGDDYYIIKLYNNIGDAYELSGNYEEAEIYYNMVYDYCRTSDDKLTMFTSLINLGNLAKSKNKYTQAEEYFNSALQIAEVTKNNSNKKYALLNIYGLYNAMSNFHEARKVYMLFVYLDSPANFYSFSDEVEKIEHKLEIEKIFQDNRKKELEFKSVKFNYLVILSIVLVIFLISLLLFILKIKSNKIRSLKLEEDKTRAELLSLQSRINPHFLFNSLNSTAGLISFDPKSAENMILQISDLLRYTLQSAKKDYVSLSEEIEICKNYLDIEKIRFGKRLTYKFIVEKEIANFNIPPLIIQPLIENSIKHAISKMRNNGYIEVNCNKSSDGIKIIVKDNGSGGTIASDSLVDKTGFGLDYLRKKMTLLYGNKFNLKIDSSDGFLVSIYLPKKN
ncbi:MAG: histidine kinase [Candidatus Delongbacteria bacterium]|nr:histidine kinase [Candidatus Delongbacteria bacterium]MBN2834072.1 histidine kinase [Candidatus Delongbacteria bacterium]